jgi:hypothetical protein
MIQIAEEKDYNHASDCGPAYSGISVERVINGNYTCTPHTGYTFGHNYRLATVRILGSGWHAYVDGSDIGGPYDVNMPQGSSMFAFALAEAVWTSSSPDFNFTWGPTGYMKWSFSTDNGSSYTVIGTSHGYQDPPSSGWILQGTPSPFRIYR